MWEYILKANQNFVFLPKQDWIGLHNYGEDRIEINLPAVIRQVKGTYKPNPKTNTSKFANEGLDASGKISRDFERKIVSQINDTIEHETIHEATQDEVNREIGIKSQETLDELTEQAVELGILGEELPSLENVTKVLEQTWNFLYQEYIVRVLQGNQSKERTYQELAQYVENRKSKLMQTIADTFMEMLNQPAWAKDGEAQARTIAELHQHVAGRMQAITKSFLNMILDHQGTIDGQMLQAISQAVDDDEREGLPNEIQRRLQWAETAQVE
tara:strand:+ start:1964 stop:2776 length:813 start_codon:yes stop_codon:yes gene_type:complete